MAPPTTTTTQELKDEHRVIERLLAILLASAEPLRKGKPIDRRIVDGGVDFITNFIENCHHKKEEGVLFPAVKSRVKDPTLTVDHLLEEHKDGKKLAKELAKAAKTFYGNGGKRTRANALIKVVENIRAFSELLRHHIAMEDGEFFPMCEEILSEAEKKTVSEKFKEVETGNGVHEKYVSLIKELEKIAI